MKFRLISNLLVTVLALTSVSVAYSTQDKAAVPQAAASKPVKATAVTKPVALIDINSASIAQLKTLAGIGDAEAAKIVAGRPYGSKAWLVSNGILSEAKFGGIRSAIVAKQQYRDANKNIEAMKKKKEAK